MIKYPERNNYFYNKIKKDVNEANIYVGHRRILDGCSITCVDIRGGKYTFSFDQIYAIGTFYDVGDVLKDAYSLGKINGKQIFSPFGNEIDFFFVPSAEQIFCKEDFEENQFTWFKRGDFSRVKGDEKGCCKYWMTSSLSDDYKGAIIAVRDNGKECLC